MKTAMIVLAGVALLFLGFPIDASGECPGHAKVAKAPGSFDSMPKVGTEATCPVMKNTFKVSKDTQHSKHEGKYYVFCCAGCKPKFDADPAKFAK